MTFKIDKNVEMPKGYERTIFPFGEMEVGDSFYIDDANVKLRAYSASSVYGSRHGKKFSVRKDGSGWRCWRTE